MLADRLDVSRTQLREVLRALEEEGLIGVSENHGVRVILVSYEIARDYYFVRNSLDGLTAQLATQQRTENDFRGRERILSDMTQCVRQWGAEGCLEVNLRFHTAITNLITPS